MVTHDGHTIHYLDSLIKVNDTVKVDLQIGKITDFIKFDIGNLAMVIEGRNMGHVGLITHRVRHHSSFDIVHVKDAAGNQFATCLTNVLFIIAMICTDLYKNLMHVVNLRVHVYIILAFNQSWYAQISRCGSANKRWAFSRPFLVLHWYRLPRVSEAVIMISVELCVLE